MKRFPLAVAAGMCFWASFAFAQATQPATTPDISGLDAASLQTLCKNLYARVAELERQNKELRARLATPKTPTAASAASSPRETSSNGLQDDAKTDAPDVGEKLKRLIALGEVMRQRTIENYRRLLGDAERKMNAPADAPLKRQEGELEAAQITQTINDLERCRGRYVPPIGGSGLMTSNLVVSPIGYCQDFQVVQVINQNTMIVKIINARGELAWLEGVDSTGLIDGQRGSSTIVFEAATTKSYTDVLGATTTIRRLTPLGVDRWIEVDKTTGLVLVKRGAPAAK